MQRLYQMVGDHRLLSEVHTDARPLDERHSLSTCPRSRGHNDAQHGYWIVVDAWFYDLTEFIELHNRGRRVVQAYAGMDASTALRARASRTRRQRRRDARELPHRYGPHAPLRTTAWLRVPGGDRPVVVDAAVAYRTFVKALSLVVEMQTALVADQSLQSRPRAGDAGAQDGPASAGAYRLQRAVETHRRFLKKYFAVVATARARAVYIASGLSSPTNLRTRCRRT